MPTMQDLIDKLGRRVQPSDSFYQLPPEDLADEIQQALDELNISDVTTMTTEQERLVMYRAMSSCYYLLAGKHAENMRFRIENDEFYGQMPVAHYMDLAEKYENLFNQNKSIEVHTVTRTQTGTGLKAPYYPGDEP